MSQLSYAITPQPARAGLLYDGGPQDIVTRTGAVLLPFGTFVVKAAGDGNVALPSATPSSSSLIEGVVVYNADTQSGLAGDLIVPGVEAGKPANILRRGRIWVYCTTSFDPDADSLYVRATINGAAATVYPTQPANGTAAFPAGNYGLVPGTVGNASDSGKCFLLGAGGFGIAYEPLNKLTAAGFLALDLIIPSTVR